MKPFLAAAKLLPPLLRDQVWRKAFCKNSQEKMKKAGTQCFAFGCNKRKRVKEDKDKPRSDSEGSDDKESSVKRKFPRTFHS